jgi:anti-sigma-K factor RskA
MSHEDFENMAALEAIGAASPDEQAALRAHLEQCDSCARTFQEMSDAASLFARGLEPVAPPASVKREVMHAIQADRRKDSQPTERSGGVGRWLLPLAATLAICLLAWSQMLLLGQRENVQQAESQAELSAQQARELAEQKNRLERENQRLASLLSSMSSASTHTIALGGQPMAPAASAKVFLDASERQAFVFFHNLPANPNDKSYQLWIIPVEGSPQGVGVFDVDHNGTASMVVQNLPVATAIKALAVTMEPKGGLPSPSGEMYLMGGMS